MRYLYYISGAFLKIINEIVKGAAVWQYISSLVNLLDHTDTQFRTTVAQELSIVCDTERPRVQGFLKRHLQSHRGPKQFKRVSNAQESAGSSLVKLKAKPDTFTQSDTKPRHTLRLCQPDISPPSAVKYLDRMCDLHQSHVKDDEKLGGTKATALFDSAAVVAFIQNMSKAIALPPVTRKKKTLSNTNPWELQLEI